MILKGKMEIWAKRWNRGISTEMSAVSISIFAHPQGESLEGGAPAPPDCGRWIPWEAGFMQNGMRLRRWPRGWYSEP